MDSNTRFFHLGMFLSSFVLQMLFQKEVTLFACQITTKFTWALISCKMPVASSHHLNTTSYASEVVNLGGCLAENNEEGLRVPSSWAFVSRVIFLEISILVQVSQKHPLRREFGCQEFIWEVILEVLGEGTRK